MWAGVEADCNETMMVGVVVMMMESEQGSFIKSKGRGVESLLCSEAR